MSVSAGAIRIVESSPQNGPIENKTADLNGIVTNLKIQRIDSMKRKTIGYVAVFSLFLISTNTIAGSIRVQP